jgi:hypothetical protein
MADVTEDVASQVDLLNLRARLERGTFVQRQLSLREMPRRYRQTNRMDQEYNSHLEVMRHGERSRACWPVRCVVEVGGERSGRSYLRSTAANQTGCVMASAWENSTFSSSVTRATAREEAKDNSEATSRLRLYSRVPRLEFRRRAYRPIR